MKYRGLKVENKNLCNVIQPFVSFTVKQRLSFRPECMSIVTINRIKATNSSTSTSRIEFFSISRFNQIVRISSLIKISATCGGIRLSTSILKKTIYTYKPEVLVATGSKCLTAALTQQAVSFSRFLSQSMIS